MPEPPSPPSSHPGAYVSRALLYNEHGKQLLKMKAVNSAFLNYALFYSRTASVGDSVYLSIKITPKT